MRAPNPSIRPPHPRTRRSPTPNLVPPSPLSPQGYLLSLQPFPVLIHPRAAPPRFTLNSAWQRNVKYKPTEPTRSNPPAPKPRKASASPLRNAVLHEPDPRVVGLKGKPLRRYGRLVAAYMLEFQPRNSAETALIRAPIRAMPLAQPRLLCLRGTQTAVFRPEMARAGRGLSQPGGKLPLRRPSHRLEDRYAATTTAPSPGF